MNELLVEQRKRITEIKFAFPNEIEAVIKNVLASPTSPYRKAEDIVFIRKFFIEELDTKAQEGLGPGQILHTISTIDVDRIGDVMMPKGADLRDYKKNPIVLWSHDYRDPDNVIGKNLWIKPDEKGIATLTEMDIDSEKAAKIFRLYQKGLLKGWSIGFIPIKMNRPKSPAEQEARPGTIVIDLNGPKPGEPRMIHEKWLLLEYSAVAMPMNPSVSTDRVAKEFDLTDAEVKEFGFQIEQIIDKTTVSDRVIMDLAGGAKGEEEEEQSGEAQAQAAAAEGGKEGGPGSDVDVRIKDGLRMTVKIADLEGNPSPGDVREAIMLALNPGLTWNDAGFRYVVELYPINYPSGHAICANRKDECFQFDYTFKDGEATIGETFTAVEMTWRREPEGRKAIQEDLAEMRESMARLEKALGDEKAGRVLSEKNRTLVQAAVDKLKASGVAMEEATAALGDLLTATEGKTMIIEEQIVLKLDGPMSTEEKDEDTVFVYDGEEVTAKEVAEEFDVEELVALVEKKKA